MSLELPKKLDLIFKTSLVFIGQSLGMAIAFVFMIVLTHWLPPNEYGEVRWVISVAVFASTIISFGLPTTLTRFIAKYKDEPEKQRTYLTNIILLFFIALVVVDAVVLIIYWPRFIFPLVVAGYSFPIMYIALIKGRMQFLKLSLAEFLQNLARFAFLIAVFIGAGLTKINVLVIYGFASWTALLGLEVGRPSMLKPAFNRISKQVLVKIIRFSFPIFITVLAVAFTNFIPFLVLEYYWDYVTVAVFSVAFLVTVVMSFAPLAVVSVTLPKISSLKKLSERKQVFTQSFVMITVLAFLAMGGLLLLGRWGLELVFPVEYETAFVPMVILGLAGIFLGMKIGISAFWEGSGRPLVTTAATVIGAVVAVTACVLLTPHYGPAGAAFGYMLGWCVAVLASAVSLLGLTFGIIKLK